MKTIVLTAVLVTAFLSAGLLPSAAQSAEQLYQKGLVKEEGEGALQDAIDLYNQVADNSSASISLRAKSLLHIGMCFEKLGTQEAVKAYQRLVSSFPSQKSEVAIARERLALLAPAEVKVSENNAIPEFTKIKIPLSTGNGVLSPDGKRMAFILDGCVWTVPVSGGVDPNIAGEPKKLTGNIGAWDMSNSFCWSGDGKWIAFNVRTNSGKNETSIYVVPSGGGEASKVEVPSHDCAWPEEFRLSLSPDGKTLAYTSGWQDWKSKSGRIYTIPVGGGKATELTEPGTQEPVFSPDGSKIAYVKCYKDANARYYFSDVWVIPAKGGKPVQISNSGQGMVFGLSWSPDGKMITFIRRPEGENPKEIWLVELSGEGDPVVSSRKVDLPLESFHAIAGWTPDNKIGLQLMNPQYETIYTVPAEGGIATQVTPRGWTSYPRYSPDGKRIFFRWGGGKIASVPSEGGAVDSIRIDSEYNIATAVPGSGNEVSPDGKTIVFSGARYFYENGKRQWEVDIFTIPVEGGKPKQLTSISNNLQDRFPCWSPDGHSIAFIRPETVDEKFIMHIYTMSGDGENLRKITERSDDVGYAPIDWTTDGKSITFFANDNTIKSIPVAGGNSVLVTEIDSANSQFDLAWSPDGKELAYTDKGKIWIYSPGSGTTREVKTGVTAHATKIGWSPDGKKIAFTAFAGGDTELWFMENFLPLERLVQEPRTKVASKARGIAVKQVWTGPEVGDFHSISADGKYLSFVARETGDLGIRNLESGKNKLLTNEGNRNGPYYWADDNLLTADGRKIIYSWYNDDDEYDLRTLEVNKPDPEIIYKPGTSEELLPVLLIPDNNEVIVQRFDTTDIWHLASVNMADGEVENLKDFEGNFAMHLSQSPDKEYMGFDFPNANDQFRFDIHLLSSDGKEELPLVDHPANDRLIGWMPGSDVMLFSSDRSGTTDLWALKTSKPGESEEPEMIMKNIGDIRPLGINTEGNLFYSIEFRKYNLYEIPIDHNNGSIQFQSMQPVFGSMRDPVWFADGKRMLCTEYALAPGGMQDHTLVLKNTETGTSRHLADNMSCYGSARLSPDEKSVLVLGYDKSRIKDENYKGGIYIIDIGSGKATELSLARDASRAYPAEWDNNGENIFCISDNQIIRHNIKSGEENVIFEDEGIGVMTILKRSADGKNLLFDLQKRDMEKYLMSISFNGEGLKTVSKLDAPFTHIWYKMIGFSPDGDYIYFSLGNDLWKIIRTGGDPQKVWHSQNPIAGFSINPDGTELVLSQYEREVEIREIENLANEVDRIYSQNTE